MLRRPSNSDLFAGVAIAAVEIPTALAYAELAGFPPVVGLYASILPLVAYAFAGSSPQLVVGPDAATCALVAAALAPAAGGDSVRYLDLSIALSIVVGFLCVVGSVLRLGAVSNLLSRPILIGFLNGMALTIISTQLGRISGIPVRTDTGFFLRLADFASKVGQVQFPTLVVGTFTLLLIFVVGWLAPRIPGALVGVLGGIALMAVLNSEKWNVETLGIVPAGLPLPHIPRTFWDDAVQLFPKAGGIALICFCSSMLPAKSFAAKNRYEVNADREFFALGLANLASGLSKGFAVSGADSRTAINDQAGGRSQASGLTAAVLMALVLALWTGPLGYIPTASLGAILIFAGASLFDFGSVERIYRVSGTECALSIVATLGVATIGVLPGIAFAVALSLILLLARASSPNDAILGQVAGVDGFVDTSEYAEAETTPGILIYRFDAALLFFNADYFKKRVRDAIAHAGPALKNFVFDMESVNAIDVTGIAALEEIRSELASRDVGLVLARVKQDLQGRLNRSGLSSRAGVVNFHPSVRSAVRSSLQS